MEAFQTYTRDLDTGAPLTAMLATVYLTGTQTEASIYSDNAGTPTPKANGFAPTAQGLIRFYAANGRYDILVEPDDGAPGTAYTIADVLLHDPEDA